VSDASGPTGMSDGRPLIPLTVSDRRFLLVCLLTFVAGIGVVTLLFHRAFPEASIGFKVDRGEARVLAEQFLAGQELSIEGDRFAGIFDADDDSKVYLERTLGLEAANQAYQDPVKLWRWQLRWFRPLRKAEVRVAVSAQGEIVGFRREIEESAPGTRLLSGEARRLAETFLVRHSGLTLDSLNFVETSAIERPNRRDHSFTWERRGPGFGSATIRLQVDLLGSEVGVFRQYLRVPEAWLNDYKSLRSQNEAAGTVATFLYALTGIAALVLIIRFARWNDIPWPTISIFAGIGAALTFFNGLNAIPLAFYEYETTQSWGAFLGNTVVGAFMGGLGVAIWITLFGAAGEPLYRRELPRLPSLSRFLTRRAIGTKSFFSSLILGYTLVAAFMAYQCVFYVVAAHFGAWAPAETPYSNLLNTQFPWVTVLLIGFLPSVTEEFSNRMFSIPFYRRLVRSRWIAIILAGFVWGFLHASYPNQPFWIRGVEVGVAGVVIGLLMYRFGIFPLLIWHYSVDAIYTSLLLLRSGKTYLVISGALAAGVLLLPLLTSIVLYLRRKGFTPEDDLTNEAAGHVEEPRAGESTAEVHIAVALRRVSPKLVALAILAVVVAGIVVAWPTDYPPRRLTWPLGREKAHRLAGEFLQAHGADPDSFRSGVIPVPGFDRYRDDGNNLPPDLSDAVAQRYATETGGLAAWERLVVSSLPASTWESRFVKSESRHEWRVTVNPRTRQVDSFHRTLPDEDPGAELTEEEARTRARELIVSFGSDPARWREIAARSEKQTNRRDWTFVFDDSASRVNGAVPRLTTSIKGGVAAGYGVTLFVPENYVRQRTLSTPLSTLLLIVRLLVMGGLFGLIAVEVVRATRKEPVPWRRLVGIGFLLALPSLLAQLNRLPALVFNYRAEIPWNIFLLTGSIGLALGVVLQVMAVIAALVALTAARPGWRDELRWSAWPKQAGHGLAVAALALALGVTVDRLELMGRLMRPDFWPGPQPPGLPGFDAIVPFFDLIWTPVLGSIIAGGTLAGLALVFRNTLTRTGPRVAVALLAACALGPDHVNNVGEAVVPTMFEILALGVAILVASMAARGNLLAYLAILPLALGGQDALFVAGQPGPGMALSGWLALGLLALPSMLLVFAILRRRAA